MVDCSSVPSIHLRTSNRVNTKCGGSIEEAGWNSITYCDTRTSDMTFTHGTRYLKAHRISPFNRLLIVMQNWRRLGSCLHAYQNNDPAPRELRCDKQSRKAQYEARADLVGLSSSRYRIRPPDGICVPGIGGCGRGTGAWTLSYHHLLHDVLTGPLRRAICQTGLQMMDLLSTADIDIMTTLYTRVRARALKRFSHCPCRSPALPDQQMFGNVVGSDAVRRTLVENHWQVWYEWKRGVLAQTLCCRTSATNNFNQSSLNRSNEQNTAEQRDHNNKIERYIFRVAKRPRLVTSSSADALFPWLTSLTTPSSTAKVGNPTETAAGGAKASSTRLATLPQAARSALRMSSGKPRNPPSLAV
ncbi:hypothetical protein GE09DRAFT_112137 [Coniochaeta sp. 2T2.1]|nr:hypothetical protein GE09DRAFT_112137 [Coniochaeta sp. 2T2.1]